VLQRRQCAQNGLVRSLESLSAILVPLFDLEELADEIPEQSAVDAAFLHQFACPALVSVLGTTLLGFSMIKQAVSRSCETGEVLHINQLIAAVDRTVKMMIMILTRVSESAVASNSPASQTQAKCATAAYTILIDTLLYLAVNAQQSRTGDTVDKASHESPTSFSSRIFSIVAVYLERDASFMQLFSPGFTVSR
jgi:hypothetical protein